MARVCNARSEGRRAHVTAALAAGVDPQPLSEGEEAEAIGGGGDDWRRGEERSPRERQIGRAHV